MAHKVHSAPLEDRVPIEGVPTGPRNLDWRPTEGAALMWWEALDGGNPRTKAPFRALRSGPIVSGIVRAALRRAGVQNPPSHGANLLRHTAATMMLRAGSTLEEIGTVLRHKSPDTTAHYAKVDVAALQQIAQPWPREDGAC
jgi:integrase